MSDNIGSQFSGLPMKELIYNPLLAAEKAQQPMKGIYLDTVNNRAFRRDDLPYSIHRPTAEEAKQALDLALRVFIEYEMPEYEPEALENFKSALKINNAFVASENGKIIGMINERGSGHVSMLFVDGNYHRNGIATALMNHIADDLKSKDIKLITVNSSPFGIPFYKNYGFTATDKMQYKDGFIYLPMSYDIEYDNATEISESY
jgi:ribosomal protein S18 acetylase RimI-like enzyme